jgi:hypothetical protein
MTRILERGAEVRTSASNAGKEASSLNAGIMIRVFDRMSFIDGKILFAVLASNREVMGL